MPEVLSMIQVKIKFFNLWQGQDSIPTCLIQIIPIMKVTVERHLQVTKMTPAPSVAVVVSVFSFLQIWSLSRFCHFYESFTSVFVQIVYNLALQAFMSCCYLCSSNIFAMINYVGFATWVSLALIRYISFFANPVKKMSNLFFHIALYRTGCLLSALPSMEAPGVGKTDQGRFSIVKIDWMLGHIYTSTFSSGQSHLPNHLRPLLHLRYPCPHDCISCGDRYTHTIQKLVLCCLLDTYVILYFQALAVPSSSLESLSTS